MARIYLTEEDIEVFVGDNYHTETDWEVFDTIDEDGTTGEKLFEFLHASGNNLMRVSADLRRDNGDPYPPENGSVARVRVWFGDTPSPYFYKYCISN